MPKIKPFSIKHVGHHLRVSRVNVEKNPETAPKKYQYVFDFTLKKDDKIIHTSKKMPLDADNLDDLKFHLYALLIQFF